jgi:large subunit ribosomal protein L16
MKQYPSRFKYRKNHKLRKSFLSLDNNKDFFPLVGNFCLLSKDSGKLKYKQIEAARRSLKRNTKSFGFLYVKAFTGISVTKKPIATRMGKGKGNHNL